MSRQLQLSELAAMSSDELRDALVLGQLDSLIRPVIGTPEQLARSDLKRMSSRQIVEAQHSGRLRDVMAGTPGAAAVGMRTQALDALEGVTTAAAIGRLVSEGDGRQLHRADLKTLTPEEISAAYRSNRLDDLLSGRKT